MLCQELPISASSSAPCTADPRKISKFSGLVIKEQINQAKFPVLLAYSPSYDRHFALKIFPYKEGEASKFFLNESRFMGLEHPNVISTVHCEQEKIIPSRNKRMRVSYTVMELAPYGDFYDVLMTKKVQFNDTLARTYFHQLIEGLEYLHSNGVAHLDIKPENLLVGEDFQLKITDFDHSSLNGSAVVPSVGTSFYRAPEIANSTNYSNHRAADVYSAAVMLFLFKTSGFLPHLEHNLYEGIDLFDLLNNNNTVFWEAHCKIQGKAFNFFEPEFCELFNSMTHIDPQQRATLEEIKASKWYNGPIYDEEELAGRMAEELDI